jgi:catechol 2,3-dioxygenase-like lactoylglutathione lyase family enzyme
VKNFLCFLFLSLGVSAEMAQQIAESPSVKLASVTILVRDHDEAARWYSQVLGFEIKDNHDTRPGRRWVTMSSPENPSFRIILHKPGSGYLEVDRQLTTDRVGKETFWILRTSDFDGVYSRLTAANVRFQSEVRPTQPAGKHVVFEDLYGNLWVLEEHSADKSRAPTQPVNPISITLLIRDYDEAAKWYSEILGFQVQDNKSTEPGRRWATMYAPQDPSFRVILHKPGNGYLDIDKRLTPDRIGKETYWILQTPDFDASFKRLTAVGVRFRSDVHTERWAKEVVFEDLYGNLFVLQQATNANELSAAPRP